MSTRTDIEALPAIDQRPFPDRSELQSATVLKYLFYSAIVLRVIVFLVIGVSNSDDHLEVVRYIAEHGMLPGIDQFNQAYHPPFYYVLAAAVFKVSGGSVKIVQALSLVFSVAGLAVAWYLITRLTVFSPAARFWSLMLVSLHPQFLMYTLFISNDSLAFLLGLALIAAAYRYLRHCTFGNLVGLGTVLGLGLATKFTFLAFILPVALVIGVVNRRNGFTVRRSVTFLAVLMLIVTALGSYKFVANARDAGNALASNLDIWPWAQTQKPTWIGPISILDVNVTKLMRFPTVSEQTVHSYPLMLYASYWYQFFPDSTFRSNTKPGLNLVGSIIYLVAVLPTAAMLVGCGAVVYRASRWVRSRRTDAWTRTDVEDGVKVLAVLMLLMNIALVLAVGWKHDVYSVFNSRLLFTSYFGFIVCLATGLDGFARRWPRIHNANNASLRVLHVLFVVYLALDISISIARPVDPLRTRHMPYGIKMTAPAQR